MSLGPHLVTIASVMVLGATAACSDEIPLPPITWEGEHLRFGTDGDPSALCAGTLPYLDGVAGHLGQLFGPPDTPLDFYWTPNGTEPFCPKGAEGCSTERGIFSRFPIHQHEMVHAIRQPDLMAQPLEEGLAEAFGDDWEAAYGADGDLEDVLKNPARYFPGDGYGPAGHFVSYLRATYGVEQLIMLSDATNYDDGYAAIRSAFEAVYGQSLDSAIADYHASYPRCDLRSYRDKSFDCSRNVFAAPTEPDESLDLLVPMSCDEPTVLGPRFGHRWTTLTLDVQANGRYHIASFPQMASGLELIHIKQCDSSCFEYADDIINRTTGTQLGSGVCLEPGRYLFRFEIDEDLTDDYRLVVTRSGTVCE